MSGSPRAQHRTRLNFPSKRLTLELVPQIPKCSNFRVLMTITALHEGEKAAPRADYEAAGLTYGGCSVCPTTWDPQGEMTKCHFYMTKLGAQARETPPLKLKLADGVSSAPRLPRHTSHFGRNEATRADTGLHTESLSLCAKKQELLSWFSDTSRVQNNSMRIS